jgi:hypothetical protein
MFVDPISEAVHPRVAITYQVVCLNVFVGERCIAITLEEMQFVGVWVEHGRQINFSTLKFDFVGIFYQTLAGEIIYLPVFILLSVVSLTTENEDSSAADREGYSVMDGIS